VADEFLRGPYLVVMPTDPATAPATDPPRPSDAERACLRRYWGTNLAVVAVLLVLWAFIGLGCGVLWSDWLNQFRLPGTGYPLGFWFAQQGSIASFVLLVLAYCLVMNRVDRRHREALARIRGAEPAAPAGSLGR